MPIIDLAISKGSLSTYDRDRLLKRVGRIAIEYEGLSGSKFAEEFTWVYVHELPAANIRQISGEPNRPLYRFTFTTLQTLLDNASKHRLGEAVARVVYEIEGREWDEREAYNRVWTFFDDYRQGDWIVGAQINSIEALRAEVDRERARTRGGSQ